MLRAAFDIGSGSIKCTLARKSSELVILFEDSEDVLFGHDFKQSRDSRKLGGAIMDRGIEAILSLKRRIDLVQEVEVEYSGVATAVFREAVNGREFIDRVRRECGIQVCVISQEQEAALGLVTAQFACLANREIIAWDSGGASFQITAGGAQEHEQIVNCFNGHWGSSKSTCALIEDVQKFDFRSKLSPNPVTKEQAEKLCEIIGNSIDEPPEWMKSKLSKDQAVVCAIGGITSIFHTLKFAYQNVDPEYVKDEYNIEQVWNSVYTFCNRTDEEMSEIFSIQPEMVIQKLVLLVSVMTKLQIRTFQYKKTNGNTLGVLGQDEFWKN
jgi:exopolyphosphatase/guanosine-5'-triphosphate,3'-diphosphate pyrophosphatase